MMPYYEEELFVLLSGLISGIPSMLLSLATYVLSALAIYTIARRRGLRKPWLAWIPVLNVWLLGSLSDQYQYVVRRENKSKRKVLLTLSILMAALTVALIVLFVVMVAMLAINDNAEIFGLAVGILGLLLPLAGISIGYVVIRYMALYDVFKSLEPGNSVLFLVLSILFSVTEPFFLFFNRNKDQGMPPRKQEPAYVPPQETQWQPQQPVQEPWENQNKDYL